MCLPIYLVPGIIGLTWVLIALYRQDFLVQRKSKPTLAKEFFSGIETHAIAIMDDDVNSMENVISNLVRIMGLSEKDAINLMLRIHDEKIAIVWTGDRNTGLLHLAEIQRAGLRGFLTEIAL